MIYCNTPQLPRVNGRDSKLIIQYHQRDSLTTAFLFCQVIVSSYRSMGHPEQMDSVRYDLTQYELS